MNLITATSKPALPRTSPTPAPSISRLDATKIKTPFTASPTEGCADDSLNPDIETKIHTGALIPANIIQPGEIIILLIKPSPLYIVLAPLRILVLIALATVLLFVTNQYLNFMSARDIVILGVLLILARISWQFIEWLSRTYILTDQRIIRIKGVTRVQVYETPLSNIQQTEVIRSIREQLTGLGTIAFATAGTGFVDAYWVMIDRPFEVQQTIIKTINRYSPRNGPSSRI
ncbi:PH domain-containing protein [Poriferisphaera sp. WC338]|uniref:PH domain-containing protein n=1 Tax=Poriferisphaera sp. WC338 TaxID=3425129 RepID=UPI003D816160